MSYQFIPFTNIYKENSLNRRNLVTLQKEEIAVSDYEIINYLSSRKCNPFISMRTQSDLHRQCD